MVIKRLLTRLQGKDKYADHERRKFARLVYPSLRRPTFKVGDHNLHVVDISEKGIKFVKDRQTNVSACVNGTAELLGGKSMEITGKIVWEQGEEVGLLITRIPQSIILEEIQTLLRELGPDTSDMEK